MKKTVLLLISLLQMVTAVTLHAQKLQIGDKMPEVILKNIFNYKTKEAALTDLKGKPIILDFWATWCGPCVEAFPKIDTYQKQFEGKMQFLLVTNEAKSKVESFYKTLGIGNISLPTLTENPEIKKFFDVRFVPHYVWIDSKGVIVAFTDSKPITKENIEALISGQSLNLPEKKDLPRFSIDFAKPLLLDSNQLHRAEILNYSLLSRIKGASSTVTIPRDGIYSGRRILITTFDISGLYSMAYGDGYRFHKFPYFRTKLNLKDTLKYHYSRHVADSLNKDNLYCYDLIIPRADSAQLFTTMQKDLQEKFGLKVQIEKRLQDCLVLKSIDPDMLKTTQLSGETKYNQYSIFMHNRPVSELVDILLEYNESEILAEVINETGYSGNVNLDFKGVNLKDINALQKGLAGYGIKISIEPREVEFLILSDH